MTTVATARESFLQKLFVFKPRRHRNLCQVVVHIAPGDAVHLHEYQYLLLTQALGAGSVTVTETDDVKSLKILNQSGQVVFAPAGIYFKGGNQDRSLIVSLLLPEGESTVPVRCVERGRWGGFNRTFTSPPIGSLSGTFCAGSTMTDQGTVWDTVNDVTQGSGSHSKTYRLGDAAEQSEPHLAGVQRVLKLDSSYDRYAVGVLFGIYAPQLQQVRWCGDIFNSRCMFREVFPGLLEAAALDALAKGWQTSADDFPSTLMEKTALNEQLQLIRMAQCKATTVPANYGSWSEGQVGPNQHVSILEDHDQQPVHILLRWRTSMNDP